MNTDTKVLNKILANQIHQHIKRIINPRLYGIYPREAKDSSIYANKSM